MKKVLIVVAVAIVAAMGFWIAKLTTDNQNLEQERQEMQELAELDKQEMENDYERLTLQYSEMMTQINNDSIIAQLTQEQMRTQQLLEELKQVKASDAREIARLKKELATVRAVLRSYVLEIDSLNRLNQNLTAENTRIKGQYAEANRQIEGLNTEKASLSEKVAIAAQLDATGISMSPLDKKGKTTKKLKKAKSFQVSFTIARNVTAQSGMKTVYVRVTTPTGALLGNAGSFSYENRSLPCSMKKAVEYAGKETPVSLYCNIDQTLQGGTFNVSIFVDGNMIGSRNFSFE